MFNKYNSMNWPNNDQTIDDFNSCDEKEGEEQ